MGCPNINIPDIVTREAAMDSYSSVDKPQLTNMYGMQSFSIPTANENAYTIVYTVSVG